MIPHILLIDDDPDVAGYLRSHFAGGATGATLETASDVDEAQRRVAERRVDLILFDILLPDGGGFDALTTLLTDHATSAIPLIVLSAARKPVDRVRAFQLGADDFVVKPFDIDELDARIRSVLRRTGQLRDMSPLTGLPGNAGITRELGARIATGQPLAVAHVDIDNFKAFNDYYGFLRGDGVITFCATVLRETAADFPGAYVGHIGGDDFVVLVRARDVRTLAGKSIDRWDAGIADFYDAVDASRGFVEVPDRRGEVRAYAIATLSIGVATNERTPFASQWEASAIAAEMKEHAKRHDGSDVRVDQRL